MKAQGQPIIGAGAGTGISAKNEEAGGADLIVIYNSGRYRMAGRGSLAGMMPYGDANGVVVEMAREVLPIVYIRPCSPVSAAPIRSARWMSFWTRSSGWALAACRIFHRGLIDGLSRRAWKKPGWATAGKSR